jgi:glycosyltransferase involved in cell wall biosynthesis
MKILRPLKISNEISAEESTPVLSVFSWVYNHKEFIQLSIDSILNQITSFSIEIIIHDDASNDGTKEIICKYQAQYPRLFNNILHLENQWSQGKDIMLPLFSKPRGEYIALSHGDDYWTDPLKLQKQVDFLEANPDYSAVFGSTEVLQENPNMSSMAFSNFGGIEDCDLMLEDVLKEKMPVHISSILFRREVLSPAFLKQNKGVVPGDRYIAAGCFLKGKVRYLAQPFSVYRRHSSGISQTIEHFGVGLHAGNVHMLLKLLKLFPQSERSVLTSYLNWRLNETAYAYRRIFEFSAKRRALKLIYRFYPFHLFVKFFLRETLIQLFPRLIQRIHAPSQPA